MTDTHWSCDLFLLCVWHLYYSAWHTTCISRPCALSCYLSPVTGCDAHCVIYYSVVEEWGHDSKHGDCGVLYIQCMWEREMETVREWGKKWQGLCCQCDSFLFLLEIWVCTCTFFFFLVCFTEWMCFTCRYSEEEIRQKVGTFRQMLMEKEGVITREGSNPRPPWVTHTHTHKW